MKKHEIIVMLRCGLQDVMAERSAAKLNPGAAAARTALRRFQSARLTRTHADFLADRETRAAAQFFLNDLYGATDFTQRDADIERVLPRMEHLIPASALLTVAEAIALDALSESLDAEMACRLGENFAQDDYIDVYRAVGRRMDREKQIGYIDSVGHSLCDLVCVPLIGGTLAMMRGPAKLAGISELHHFLERGFTAFKKMKRPQEFVSAIVTRETVILEDLYAGRGEPFRMQ